MQFGRSLIARCRNHQYRWTLVHHLTSNRNALRPQHRGLSIALSSKSYIAERLYGKTVALSYDSTRNAPLSTSASSNAEAGSFRKTWNIIKRPKFRRRTEDEKQHFRPQPISENYDDRGQHRSIPLPPHQAPLLHHHADRLPTGRPVLNIRSHLKPLKSDPRPNSQVPRKQASVEVLEEELRWMAQNDPNPTDIKSILTILIQDRGIKPGSQHYDALILANCDPAEGSADNVQAILQEMEDSGIEIGATTYAAALSALAIHPSITLILSILSSLESRWIPLSPSMNHNLVLCLIRTSQLELANDLLNHLHVANKPLPIVERTPVPKYLYILLITALIENQDYEGVMRWLYRLHERKSMEMDIPAPFWGWVLQHAARDGDGWVTGWLWQDWTEKMRIRPTRETCLHVLRIAARDGVPWLAESVRDTVEYGGCAEATSMERMEDNRKDKGKSKSSNNHIHDTENDKGDISNLSEHWAVSLEPNNYTTTHRDSSIPFEQDLSDNPQGRKPNSIETTQTIGSKAHHYQPSPPNTLTPEEEALIDQAYTAAARNISQEKPSEENTSSSSVHTQTTVTYTPPSSSSSSSSSSSVQKDQTKDTRVRQVKPGNLWPLFRKLDDCGPTRFDPWDALGPKSRT